MKIEQRERAISDRRVCIRETVVTEIPAFDAKTSLEELTSVFAELDSRCKNAFHIRIDEEGEGGLKSSLLSRFSKARPLSLVIAVQLRGSIRHVPQTSVPQIIVSEAEGLDFEGEGWASDYLLSELRGASCPSSEVTGNA